MKALVDMVHLILCDRCHEYDMTSIVSRSFDRCYYYLENDIEDGDKMEDHLKWYGVVEKFKASLSLNSDQEALNFIKESIAVSQELRRLVDRRPTRLDFISKLLNLD